MGGEHHVCLHSYGDPCRYIHSTDNEILAVSEEDQTKWKNLKPQLITFIKSKNPQQTDKSLNEQLKSLESVECLSKMRIYWSYREDNQLSGQVMHDIVKLLMLVFPAKICACFDRCMIYHEFPDQEWDMCKFPCGVYNSLPKFVHFDINSNNIIKSMIQIIN